MVQITIIRHSKSSQVQVPNTMSSYIWLLLHYYLQESQGFIDNTHTIREAFKVSP